MRRHGPVTAHCTDSEDFPDLLYLVVSFCTCMLSSKGLGLASTRSVGSALRLGLGLGLSLGLVLGLG